MYDVIAESSVVRESEQKGDAVRWKSQDIERGFSGILPISRGQQSLQCKADNNDLQRLCKSSFFLLKVVH